MLLNAEFPAGLWTKKHHSTQNHPKNTSVLFGVEVQTALTSQNASPAALRDFRRSASNFRTSEERFLSLETSRVHG